MSTRPQAVILAGPNGSGKSTAATQLVPAGVTFANADMIAQEISGLPGTSADVNSGRILLCRISDMEAQLQSFAFETTLATRMLVHRISTWQSVGYRVHLIFMYLQSADLAVERVAARVRAGGHDVPEATVRRRYRAGLRNFFHLYRPLVDTWRIYDNSTLLPFLIARGHRLDSDRVELPSVWSNLQSEVEP